MKNVGKENYYQFISQLKTKSTQYKFNLESYKSGKQRKTLILPSEIL